MMAQSIAKWCYVNTTLHHIYTHDAHDAHVHMMHMYTHVCTHFTHIMYTPTHYVPTMYTLCTHFHILHTYVHAHTHAELTCTHEVPTLPIPEVMEHLIPVWLVHLGVDEETRVAKLSDLLCKQLHSLHRVAEYDTLIDLKFGEESIETVDLLSFLHVGIVLCDPLQSQFIHQVDGIGTSQVSIL